MDILAGIGQVDRCKFRLFIHHNVSWVVLKRHCLDRFRPESMEQEPDASLDVIEVISGDTSGRNVSDTHNSVPKCGKTVEVPVSSTGGPLCRPALSLR